GVRPSEGDHKGSPLPWTNGPGKQIRTRVGAIPCGRPAGANAAALHSCCHSPTKSYTGRFFRKGTSEGRGVILSAAKDLSPGTTQIQSSPPPPNCTCSSLLVSI